MKKILALVLALTLVLASCAVAFTDGETPTYKATVTVNEITAGNTLKLYKVAAAEVGEDNAIHYTMTTGLPAAYDTIEEIAAITSNSDEANAMANAYGNFFGGTNPTFFGSNSSGTTVTINNVDPGYYFAIVSGNSDSGVVYKSMLINAVMVPNPNTNGYDAATPSATAKKEPITITKKEKQSPTSDEMVKTTDGYKLGDYIPFTISTYVPNYPADSKYTTVIITDTPVGLEDDLTTNFVVKIGGETVATTNYDLVQTTTPDDAETTDYVEGGKGFTLTLKDTAFILSKAGQSLEVSYRAKLVGPVKNDGSTINTATLTYNPNPFEDTTVEPPDHDDQKTYGFVFPKTDANGTALANAVFALYDSEGENAITDKDGNALTFTTTVVDGKAYVYWEGLAAGTYTVKETAAPSGYVPVQDFTVILNGSVCTGDNPATTKRESNYYVITTNVENNLGSTLPSTGGIGTTIFYILGGLLVVGAAVILVARRKASN